MILTEQPFALRHPSMRRDVWGRSDDVRRSIDVLDQVLSEFDDIEPVYGGDEEAPGTPSSDGGSGSGDQEVPEEPPPPVDRSLKPKSNPPMLPQKTRKKSHHGSADCISGTPGVKSPLGSINNSTNSHRSQGGKGSEVSSHEYQEINSDFCANPQQRRESEGKARDPAKGLGNPQRQRHRSNKERSLRTPVEGAYDPRLGNQKGVMESPLRKSKSVDVSLTTDDLPNGRGRKSSRRHLHQRRGRSSERVLDQYPVQPPFFDPRRLPESGPVDPRLVDPKFIDSRLVDPRFYDPRFVDPRFLDRRVMEQKMANQRFLDQRFLDAKMMEDQCDPRLLDPLMLEPPVFVDPSRIPFDGPPSGPFPIEDPMQFPHIMTPPGSHHQGPFSLPPPNTMDFHPHTIPPYEFSFPQDPLGHPDPLMDFPFHPMDPRFDQLDPNLGPFDPRLQKFDPALMPPPIRPHPAYAVDFPLDHPFQYPPDLPPINYLPRERMSLDGGMGFPHHNNPRFPHDMSWMPPTPEEARKTVQRIVRNRSLQHSSDEVQENRKRLANDPRMSKTHGDQHLQHLKSTGSSGSSGRSSPYEDSRGRPESQCPSRNKFYKGAQQPQGGCKRTPEMDPGSFKVGEAVRKDSGQMAPREFGGKDTISLPRFISGVAFPGGKDSGFDESPMVEDSCSLLNPSTRGGTPVGVGGGFVVAGVFSDSSKMYIPAPPSPTPDYDNEHGHSDGEDSDIPQEPFYVSSKKKPLKEAAEKTAMSSNRGSLSDDSLQEGKTERETNKKPGDKENNPLQAMLAEFHMGLPPPLGTEEGRFSDDSLEEESSSNVSPSRPTTSDLQSQRVSTESLNSMDGSTTSFDYMSDLHNKNTPSSPNGKQSKASSPMKESKAFFVALNSPNKNSAPKVGQNPKLKKQNKNTAIANDKVKKAYIQKSSSPAKSEVVNELGTSAQVGGSEITKKVPKFETIRHLIKEGLIEGLDETPPDFAPPPPPPLLSVVRSSSTSEERADSGIGSTASTNNRADESGGSDSLSDKLSTTPPKSSGTNSSNDMLTRRTSSPPPLPPPRDSSMGNYSSGSTNNSSTQPVSRNQSWLYKSKRSEEQRTNSMSNNNSNLSNVRNSKREKVTHIDGLRRNSQANKNDNNVLNENLTSQYHLDYQKNESNGNIFHENTKNLQSNNKKRNENAPLIYDDQASVSSHGSRSGRFFSRLSESMKSGSRSNSPLVNKNGNQQKNKRGTNKYHADFIRAPSHNKKEAPQPPLGSNPPDFRNISDPSSIVPLTRDGSGRFRSIEDLADLNSVGKSLELKRTQDDLNKKRKKNTTLPPNLTPSDMLQQEVQLKQSTSQGQGNKNKDDCNEGSRFKFNIFKGFWRRNKYSFDKT